MDYCPDCNSLLRDSVCSRCSQIVLHEPIHDMACWNCNRKTLKFNSSNRAQCEFCLYFYFFTKGYRKIDVDEVLRSTELKCNECNSRVVYRKISEAFVCTNCGLVSEDVLAIDDDQKIRSFKPSLPSQLERYRPLNY